MTDEAKVSQQVSRKCRELGAEEPPRALDDAILAAATRAARSLHGSARPWTKRWAVPLSLAAVVTLSVTVTLRIQHEKPGIESPAPQAAGPPVALSQLKQKAEAQPESATRKNAKEVAKAAAADEAARARGEIKGQPTPSVAAAPAAPEPKPFAAGDASSSTSGLAAQAVAPAPQAGPVRALAKRAEAQEKVQALKDAQTPEQELERIAGLRRQEKHEEADKALAEFRKRYPDYKIPDAMRERVERR